MAVALFTGPREWQEPTPPDTVDTGLATYYAPGLMDQVRQNRDITLPPGATCVALNRAGDLERTVWLERGGRVYQAVSCDCAQADHYDERLEQDRIVEVPYDLALSWKMDGPEPVRVYYYPPLEVLFPDGPRPE